MLALLTGIALAAQVDGVVRERGTRDPVPGAVVRVAGQDGGVSTDAAGAFRLELPDGAWSLLVEGPAHLPEPVEITVPRDTPLVVFVRADQAPPEIVVEAEVDSPHHARQVLDRERVEKTPGTHDDPLRLIQALPGVTMTPEYSPSGGAIALRGARPDESRVYLDGVEIPYLYHFQQYASVVHTRLLDEVAVYPSAFAANYGDATGGVVAVRTREPDPQQVHGGVTLNTIMGGAYVQAPAGENVAVSASARRSYADLGEDSNDQYTRWPVFWDYLSRVDLRPHGEARYALTVLGAGDTYGRFASDTAALDPLEAAEAPDFRYTRRFHGALLTARHTGERFESDSVIGFTDEAWTGALGPADQDRGERALTARHVTTLLRGDALRLRMGGDVRGAWTTLQARTDRGWPELGIEAPLLARGIAVDRTVSRVGGGAFVEPRLLLGIVEVQPGLRVQGDSGIGAVGVEPRGSVRVSPTDDITLRAATGRYLQAPEPEALDPRLGDPELGWSRAVQGAVGVDWAIAGRWEVAVDGWARSLKDGVRLPVGAPLEVLDGSAQGLEFTTRYRIRERFFSWISLTLGRTELGGAPTAFDQPYALSTVASWDFKPGWNAGVRWRYAAGLPLTPIVGSIYDGDSDSYQPVPGTPFSTRLPDYQKLDLHLERDIAFRRWTLALYAEVWWVPSANNTLYRVYSYDYLDAADVRGPPVLPLLGARAEL